jgi:hypothetical protein
VKAPLVKIAIGITPQRVEEGAVHLLVVDVVSGCAAGEQALALRATRAGLLQAVAAVLAGRFADLR